MDFNLTNVSGLNESEKKKNQVQVQVPTNMRMKWVQHVSQTWTVRINGSTRISSLDFSGRLFFVAISKLIIIAVYLGRALKSSKTKSLTKRNVFVEQKRSRWLSKKRFHFVSRILNCTSIIGTFMCLPLLSFHSFLFNMTKNAEELKQNLFLTYFRCPIVSIHRVSQFLFGSSKFLFSILKTFTHEFWSSMNVMLWKDNEWAWKYVCSTTAVDSAIFHDAGSRWGSW